MLSRVLPVLFVVMLLAGAYGFLSNEDYEEDSFTVTFTFSCESVLHVPSQYPMEVVEECAKMDSDRRRK